ncbi:MAG: ComF family protein [Candidatus Bipolaricaulota bacterium]|nr:ComF family protein [Candidatus Bipolaricaulota bacterium]MDW8126863.1 ComF family protein [Candidatus Bipolaricaulota bacterium]
MELLFPPHCLVCGKGLGGLAPLCADCFAEIRRWQKVCEICGVGIGPGLDLCEECAVEAKPFLWARSIGPYEGVLRALVFLVKYEGERMVAKLLAQEMAKLFLGEVAVVTWVPPDPLRLKQRGFHGAELLGREVAEVLDLPAQPLLRKVAHSPEQVGRPREERIRAMHGLFAATRKGHGESVLLVDDVLTTGATVAEGARALQEAGFGEVAVLTCARTAGRE